MTDLQSFLSDAIKKYVTESPLNRLKDIDGSPMYEEPLVGFADGDDPLFLRLKKVVGEFHRTPREALASYAETTEAPSRELSPVGVVSWVLPIARETRLSNRAMTEGPSPHWNHTRFQGEDFNDRLRRHVALLLIERGYAATAPALLDWFHWLRTPNGFASPWSERHVAYVAGLGTFSLTDGLITARGMAHRLGSVVADVKFAATPRDYSHHLQYCPYPRDGSCGACIARCPAAAIGPAGHDKVKCHEYVFGTIGEWSKRPGYMGSHGTCGLCQTGVPCESRIP